MRRTLLAAALLAALSITARAENITTTGSVYLTPSSASTLTNKTFDTAGTGNSFLINGVAVTANTGTGAVARALSPAFTTPNIGAATATTINGNTITSGTGTLTLGAGKTATVNNTLTLSGTDGSTLNIGTGGTLAASATTDTTVASNISSGALPAGRLPALTGDVTSSAGSAATTLAAGSASNLNSGTLPAGRLPALTGDITSSAGNAATTLAAGSASNLNSGTLAAGRMPALTGDTTSSAGSVATATTKINGVDQTTAWATYTPTLSCGTGTLTTSSASGASKIIGKSVLVRISVIVTTLGTCASTLNATLPSIALVAGVISGREGAITGKAVVGQWNPGSATFFIVYYDSTFPAASGASFTLYGVYESQ